jgi:cytochrome c556
MKKTLVVVSLGLASLCWAQGEQELQPIMKNVAATSGKARKDVEAKAGPDVAKDAQQLQEIYKQIGAFFTARKMDDAVKIAHDAEASAKDLAAAATAGDAEKMDAAMKAVGGSCGSCHMAHRDKAADGSYKIK